MDNQIIATYTQITSLPYGDSLEHMYILHNNGDVRIKMFYRDNEGNTFKEDYKTIGKFNFIDVVIQKNLIENIAGGLVEQHRWLNSML